MCLLDLWFTCLNHLKRNVQSNLSENTDNKANCPVWRKIDIVNGERKIDLYITETGAIETFFLVAKILKFESTT